MKNKSNQDTKSIRNEKYLWVALTLTTLFVIVEIIGSVISNSLALLSDAAHLLSDAAALIISIIAIRLGRRQSDTKRTFGYYRFEILAAIINAVILFLVAFYIFYEAYIRLFSIHYIRTTPMLIVAATGVIVNFISVWLLRIPSKENLNIKSAYLDAKADLISSLGVILGAILIRLTAWQHIDSIIAIGIAVWILPRAWTLLKECVNILLEGVPEGIELAEINNALMNIKGVLDVHDLHVWALTSGKISLTAHLVVEEALAHKHALLNSATKLLEEKFQITHSTIQIEITKCDSHPHMHP